MILWDIPYNFKIANIKFGSLSTASLYEMFKDGRVASHFIEKELEHWFPSLLFEDGRGYDHRCLETNTLFDAKCFTKSGANFAPSVMIGAGRKINEEKFHEHAIKMNYIFCDIYEFPVIKVIFKKGIGLMADYPTGKIPFKDRNKIFGPVTQIHRTPCACNSIG